MDRVTRAGNDRAVQPGVYEMQRGLAWDDVLAKLRSGDVVQTRLTIPEGWTAEQTSRGRSVVYVGVPGELQGAMSFGDELKPGVAASVRHLKYEGIRWITVLSGDHPDAVRAIAAEIGADEVKAGLLPHEKVEAVRQLAASSIGVAMVGDGVNDAAALARADLGLAMGTGTDAAIEASDITLVRGDLRSAADAIRLSRRTLKTIKGKPMIRQTVETVLQSRASPVVVVTGHDAERVRDQPDVRQGRKQADRRRVGSVLRGTSRRIKRGTAAGQGITEDGQAGLQRGIGQGV